MTARKYATKTERFAAMKAEAIKTERAALAYMEGRRGVIGNDLWKKASELWAEANAYSIRWNII